MKPKIKLRFYELERSELTGLIVGRVCRIDKGEELYRWRYCSGFRTTLTNASAGVDNAISSDLKADGMSY